MAAMHPKKGRSIKDMLTKPTAGKTETDNPGTGKQRKEEMDEAPVTSNFLEGLFASLMDDIKVVKRDLLHDLKVVCRELEDVEREWRLCKSMKMPEARRSSSYNKKYFG
ncbi:hypothetical protein NDU88_002671 [Pleurodeles waltl]|uniref:Uncharacterized protein n=1 Tax=Pleurodeles waltl TaxID=8319 RepID=A0AAV7W328_PLEWA|nr:hypothetical protein NDU88_002671 [Pleurodeles waltl]